MDQVLKKWKKLGINSSNNNTARDHQHSKRKSIKFLKKKTVLSTSCNSSSSSTSSSSDDHRSFVPKGSLAVCVGEEMERFVIPTGYLCRRAFAVLLREAEEEYGFEHEGVLRIPCPVALFKRVLETLEEEEEEEFCY